MGETCSFICKETKSEVWCGQRTKDGFFLYTNDSDWPKIMKWLNDHVGKDIQLVGDYVEREPYEEVIHKKYYIGR